MVHASHVTSEAKVLAAALANRFRFLDAYAFLKRKHIGAQIVILSYHRVSPAGDDWSTIDRLSPQGFESQIAYLCENFEILSLDRLTRDLQQGRPLPNKAVVITFDDGYLDNYVYAHPILRKYGVPATFFLATGHIGGSRLFWWDRVAYLVHHTEATCLQEEELGRYALKSVFDRRRASLTITGKLEHFPEERKNDLIEKLANMCGVDIPADLGSQLILSWEKVKKMSRDDAQFGAHSVTHADLANLPLEVAKWEIRHSKEDIEERLGRKANFFAYPNGSLNSEIVDIVKQTGFVAGVGADASWITPRSDLHRLGRIPMIEDSNRSAALLCGLWGDLGDMSRRL